MSRLESIERQEAALKADKKLARIEAAFVVKKEAGNARVAEEKAVAFKAAKSADEYESLVAQIAPAVSTKEKLKLREYRQDFRDNVRMPKTGAQPAAINVGVEVEEA